MEKLLTKQSESLLIEGIYTDEKGIKYRVNYQSTSGNIDSFNVQVEEIGNVAMNSNEIYHVNLRNLAEKNIKASEIFAVCESLFEEVKAELTANTVE